jgi:hypothetical protein
MRAHGVIHHLADAAAWSGGGALVVGLAGPLLWAALSSSVMAEPSVVGERPAIVTTGPWVFAERNDRPQSVYPLSGRTEAPASTSVGWAAFASSDGRTLDFARPWRWPVDPNARPTVTEVGFGWRQPNWAATAGYVQPDYVRRAGYPANAGPKALVGLSFTVRVP